jgi:predicted transcriptional regulator
MPIDGKPGARNLITKLAAYKQVIDVENSVTVVDDLLGVVRGLVEKKAAGVFHATNEGTMKHRDLLALYRELVDPEHHVEFISDDELTRRGLALKGRSNCVLTSTTLATLGLSMRPIQIALRDVMTQYARSVAR